MKREIKFRGKRVDGKGWVYGCYFIDHPDGTHYIGNWKETPMDPNDGSRDLIHEWLKVDPATVGQFSVLHDKDGKEIWEGDDTLCFGVGNNVIEFVNGAFGYWVSKGKPYEYFVTLAGNEHFDWADGRSKNIEVIGNIHDNPELIKNNQQ